MCFVLCKLAILLNKKYFFVDSTITYRSRTKFKVMNTDTRNCVCVCLRERGGDIERDNFDKNADKNVEQVCVSGVNELFLLFNSDASSNILF